MSGMRRGLSLVLGEANHARLHAALTLACAAAALGRPVRLFLHGEAVAALQPSRQWAGDAAYAASAMPSVAELLEGALEMGVTVMACQSGLHLCGIAATSLPEGVETGGMVAFLAGAGEDETALG
ncbi:DsrE family protein [Bradyrhizobium sp.]|uniref:DsrE family protein n=1 Tax=Bradyrhizobium sp. TaxID=376 RepID=UPI0025BF150A|nr:DsrE family protein [Bradyrhizobium sp.]